MGAGREVWVKVRASEAERAEWHAKARAVGLSLSDLVRRSVGRVRTWTVAHAELERERTRCLARIGSNLNQIARWANTHKENSEAVEVVAHLVAIERALDTLAVEGEPGRRRQQQLTTSPASHSPHTNTTRIRSGNRKRTRKKSKSCGAIRTRWPPWPTRLSSSTSTRRAGTVRGN